MKQEDKELLLRDLCARLPYEVKCNISRKNENCVKSRTIDSILDCHWLSECKSDFYEIKPYLFPLSSMTEEQRKEFLLYSDYSVRVEGCGKLAEEYHYELVVYKNQLRPNYKDIDWLNKNHFDYRGLIEKDLAIDATGKNIYP